MCNAISLLLLTVPLIFCGCRSPYLRSQEPDNKVAIAARVPDRTGSVTTDRIQLASATADSFGPESEIAENFRRAEREAEAGRLAQAAHFYERVLRDKPDDATAHHRLAFIADLSQDYQVAEGHYREALKSRPADGRILNDLGYSFFLQQRFGEAEQVLRRAVTASAQDAQPVANLALLYATLGEYEKAYQVLKLATPDGVTAQRRLLDLIAAIDRERENGAEDRSGAGKLHGPIARGDFRGVDPTGGEASVTASLSPDSTSFRNARQEIRSLNPHEIRRDGSPSALDRPAIKEQPEVTNDLPLWTPVPRAPFSQAPVHRAGLAGGGADREAVEAMAGSMLFSSSATAPSSGVLRGNPVRPRDEPSVRSDVVTMTGHSQPVR